MTLNTIFSVVNMVDAHGYTFECIGHELKLLSKAMSNGSPLSHFPNLLASQVTIVFSSTSYHCPFQFQFLLPTVLFGSTLSMLECNV